MIRAGLKRLRDERSGNFSIMGALAMVPLLMGVGFALDYATMTRIRSELQNATDAAVLAVGREGPLLKQGDAERIAGQILTATLGKPYDRLQVRRVGTQVTVSARVSSGRMFGTFFDFKDAGIMTASTADLATLTYEIGLVLDTTGSMRGGKLADMQDAVKELIDTMSAQVKEKDKLKFALVPFATFVNVGPQFGPKFKNGKQMEGGAEWLDLTGSTKMPQAELSDGASRFQLFENMKQSWAGCVESRYGEDYETTDAPATTKNGSLFVPALAIDEPKGRTNDYIKFSKDKNSPDFDSDPIPGDKSTKQKQKRWAKYGVSTNGQGEPLLGGLLNLVGSLLGVVTGGYQPVNPPKLEQKTVATWSIYPTGPNFGCDAQPITPLTNDYKDLRDKVDALTVNGNTNIAEGVAWGMRVLSPGAPFTEGSPVDSKGVQRILIVLTDGANTLSNDSSGDLKSTYSSYGYVIDGRLGVSSGTDEQMNQKMNEQTLKSCNAAKAAGMEIYTIMLEVKDDKTGTLLQNCASTPANYINVQNRSKLGEAFKGIKDAMVKLKLAS